MAKKQQKYICINSYIYIIYNICHVYISIIHFKSLCGNKTQIKEESRSARTTAEGEERRISSYTPAEKPQF